MSEEDNKGPRYMVRYIVLSYCMAEIRYFYYLCFFHFYVCFLFCFVRWPITATAITKKNTVNKENPTNKEVLLTYKKGLLSYKQDLLINTNGK